MMKVKKIRHERRDARKPFIALEEGAIFTFPEKESEYYIKITPMYTAFMLDAYLNGGSKMSGDFGGPINCMRIRSGVVPYIDPYSSSKVMRLYDHIDPKTEVIPVDAELVIYDGGFKNE